MNLEEISGIVKDFNPKSSHKSLNKIIINLGDDLKPHITNSSKRTRLIQELNYVYSNARKGLYIEARNGLRYIIEELSS
ncbi:MAG: hypothetical protein JW791_02550 [Nanoarchaeota archaeon]|nr:hypothetical protein [Nanoarchaeota archaeon]